MRNYLRLPFGWDVQAQAANDEIIHLFILLLGSFFSLIVICYALFQRINLLIFYLLVCLCMNYNYTGNRFQLILVIAFSHLCFSSFFFFLPFLTLPLSPFSPLPSPLSSAHPNHPSCPRPRLPRAAFPRPSAPSSRPWARRPARSTTRTTAQSESLCETNNK